MDPWGDLLEKITLYDIGLRLVSSFGSHLGMLVSCFTLDSYHEGDEGAV